MRKSHSNKIKLTLSIAILFGFGGPNAINGFGQTRPVITTQKFVSDNPIEAGQAIAAYQKAIEQYRQGQYADAIDSLTQAINRNPRFAEGHNSLCVIYDELKRTPEAIAACQRAVAAKSDYAQAFYNLGLVYGDENRLVDAITALNECIRLNQRYPEAHYNLGRMYDQAGRYAEAVESLQRAIKLKPDYASAYNELGVVYCRLARYDEAVSALRRAVSYGPARPQFHGNLGTAYYLSGNYPEAIESLEEAVNQNPDLTVAQDNLGQVYLKVGRYEDAIRCMQRAIQINLTSSAPSYEAELYNDLGCAFSHLKRYGEAAKLLTRATELKPELAVAVFNLGLVRLMLQDKPAALNQYAALKTLDRGLADKLYASIYRGRIVSVPERDSGDAERKVSVGN